MLQKIFTISPISPISPFHFHTLQRRVSYYLWRPRVATLPSGGDFVSGYEPPGGFPKLGRWNIQYDNQIIYRKIDQANEDHCGCCVNEFNVTENLNEQENEKDEKDEENYMIPYCM